MFFKPLFWQVAEFSLSNHKAAKMLQFLAFLLRSQWPTLHWHLPRKEQCWNLLYFWKLFCSAEESFDQHPDGGENMRAVIPAGRWMQSVLCPDMTGFKEAKLLTWYKQGLEMFLNTKSPLSLLISPLRQMFWAFGAWQVFDTDTACTQMRLN